MEKITQDIFCIGVNDHDVDLFEGQYKVPNGMAYNSYLIRDEKICVMDTVDARFGHEWLDHLAEAAEGKAPDYLVVQHMEPDHSANILSFAAAYPKAVIVGNAKTFAMMEQFYGSAFEDRRLVVNEGDSLTLGRHTLRFVFAPMVHWPEVMMTWDEAEKILFSADAFGKFGARDAKEPWEDEARRYYIGIVGKYGAQVQNVLKKAAGLAIEKILPLHGPFLTENLGYYLNLYKTWSSYGVETDGVFLPYTSVYGHTKKAVELLAEMLRERGCPRVEVMDLARCDMAAAAAAAFRYGKVVFATTTYNAGIFPFMKILIEHLTERNFAGRTVAFIENGTWAPQAMKTMKGMLEGCRDLTFLPENVTIRSDLNEESRAALTALADALCREYAARDSKRANKNDLTALYRLGYGLYVVTTSDGKRDNGLIVNTVTQVSDSPNRVAVCINKKNYSYHVVKNTGKMNVNCLSTEAPFAVFERFGFVSGRSTDKFEGMEKEFADNGLVFLTRYANAFLSLEVESEVDLVSHGMFVCRVTEARVLSDKPTMTYAYYQDNVKPKPQTEGKKGWVCKICGYVHEGEDLPEDFICPLCKHGAADFEPIQ